jgi:splicing factor 45
MTTGQQIVCFKSIATHKTELTALTGQFAPPSNFAPPPNINDAPPPPPAAVQVPNDASGEEAFARRAALAEQANNGPNFGYTHPPPPPPEEPVSVSNDPTEEDAYIRGFQKADTLPAGQNLSPPPPPRPLDAFQPSSATISRAPVRYTLPPPPEDIPASEAELEAAFAQEEKNEEVSDENGPRSLRPGQKGFAERLLSKYGYTKGSGLGATGSGMVKPLQVQVEKRKKRPDSEGGGFVTPAGRGKIIGSKQTDQYASKFGPMCEVIILRGMLDGMDIDSELEGSRDGGLMQEIGEECNEKVGYLFPWMIILALYSRSTVWNRGAGFHCP